MVVHVGLGEFVGLRAKQFLQHIPPLPHGLSIDCHYDVANDRRSNPFVIQVEADVRVVARAVFEDRPDGGADLLALDVGGVTGNEERGNADERGDDGFVSNLAPGLICSHGRDGSEGRNKKEEIRSGNTADWEFAG